MEEGQHLRYHGLYLLRLLLAELRRNLDPAETDIGRRTGADRLAAFLFMWGCFTAVLFVGTLRLSRALQAVFLSLTILFFLLAIGDITGSSFIKTVAGLEGILCGAIAIYAGLAQVLNEVYGRTIAPLG